MTNPSQATITAADLPGLPTRVLLDLHRLATANRAGDRGSRAAMADRGDRCGDESEGHMEVTREGVHPGAAHFGEEARRAVAEGPLFDRPHGEGGPVLTCDGARCLVLTLADADGCDWAQFLTFDDGPDPLIELMERNDRGEYAGEHGRANLRRDLLGVER